MRRGGVRDGTDDRHRRLHVEGRAPIAIHGESEVTYRYPILRPSLPAFDDVAEEFRVLFDSTALTTARHTEALEREVGQVLGVRNVIALSSCTTGLVFAMKAMNLQGEVIVPSYTFNSSGLAVHWAGLTPVFCDCIEGTLNIDPDSAQAALSDRTVAVMPVAVYGLAPDIDAIERMAAARGLKVIYDSAMGLGSRYRGRYLGGFGDAEVFSLSTKKLVTGVEGGLVTTNDDQLAAVIRRMRDYGRSTDSPDFVDVGLSARFSELHAVIARHNLARLDSVTRDRRGVVARYRRALGAIPGVGFVEEPADCEANGLMMVIRIDAAQAGVTRDELMAALAVRGIQASRYFYPPLHRQGVYQSIPHRCAPSLEVSERVGGQVLALPIYTGMRDEAIAEIAGAVREVMAQAVISR